MGNDGTVCLMLQHLHHSTESGDYDGINITSDRRFSTVGGRVVCGTVFGGALAGKAEFKNSIFDVGCTVSGGFGNTAGFDDEEAGRNLAATVSGGTNNNAAGQWSCITGGGSNTASGPWSSVLGGSDNRASGNGAVTTGGSGNHAAGVNSATLGGFRNFTGGDNSIAAGNHARTRGPKEAGDENGDEGTFVFADSREGDEFVSTGPNQFLVRAQGGMGLNTNAPRGGMEIAYDSNASRPQLTLTEQGADFARLNFRNTATPRYFALAGNSAGLAQADDRFYFYHSAGGNFMTFTGDGKVGIGTASPGAFRFAVNGSAAKPGGGAWAVFSDSRLKDNITPMTGTLDRLMQLRGYTFDYKPRAIEQNLALPGTQVGLLAEEVEKVFPQWVEKDGAGYRFVTERSTTALMVEGLRDLRAEKDAQIGGVRLENQQLREENTSLRARLDAIEAKLSGK